MADTMDKKSLAKLYEKVKNSKVTNRGVYLEPNELMNKATGEKDYAPATYRLKILNTACIETRENGPAFTAELEVIESDNDKHPVGSKRNFYNGIKDDTGFGNMKQFLLAAVGIDMNDKEAVDDFMTREEDGFKDVFEQATQEDGKGLEDLELNCRVVRIITKKNQKPFNRHDFSRVEDEDKG